MPLSLGGDVSHTNKDVMFLSKLVPVIITRWKSLRLTLYPVAENGQQCEGTMGEPQHVCHCQSRQQQPQAHYQSKDILTSALVLNPGIMKLEIWRYTFFFLFNSYFSYRYRKSNMFLDDKFHSISNIQLVASTFNSA